MTAQHSSVRAPGAQPTGNRPLTLDAPLSLLTESVCKHCQRRIFLQRDGAWGSSAPCGDVWHSEADGGYSLSHVPVVSDAEIKQHYFDGHRETMAADKRRNDASRKIQDLRIEHSIASAGLPKGRAPRTKRIGIEVCLRGK